MALEAVIFAPVRDWTVVQCEGEVSWPPGSVVPGGPDVTHPGRLGAAVVEVDPVAVLKHLVPLGLPPLGVSQQSLVHPANGEEGLVVEQLHAPTPLPAELLPRHGEVSQGL